MWPMRFEFGVPTITCSLVAIMTISKSLRGPILRDGLENRQDPEAKPKP
jgi:hypothetical protein